jgi:glycine/D-amino acid oxidase-like deaminating enzyme
MERDEIARLEPRLREAPSLAAFSADAGAIELVETTKLFVRVAQEADARVQLGLEARLVVSGSRIIGVKVADEVLGTDVVVVAAGVDSNLLMEPLGMSLPIDSSPGMLVRFKTPSPLVNGIVASPPRELRQVSANIMVSPEFGLEGGPQTAAERALKDVQHMLTGVETLKLDGWGIGQRPIPADGLPIVGFAPKIEGLYVTVAHPGVNLAPAVGRFATMEILDGVSVNQLAACRPQRFLGTQASSSR